MARYERFTFLLDKKERAQIAELAEFLHRTQSDVVRSAVLESARQLAEQNHTPTARASAQDQEASYATS